jgi:serine/threonine protein kinase
MKVLSVQKAKSSLLHSAFDNIETFELDDKPFDSGAFGAVYFCHSANGKPLPVPQVVKILIDDGTGSARQGIRTIQNLQDKIIQHNMTLKANNQKPIEQIQCMYALPQLSYEGTFNGKTVYGYAQNRLNTQEFILFKDFFDEPDPYKKKKLREKYNQTSLENRLQLAYDLAEGFQTLREMAYIHADLNPKNLFIRLNPPALTLIDYDSGVVVNNPNDQADTFGQLGGWIAPEIHAQLLQNQSGRVKVDLNTDTWSVAIAIHYLLFLFHPLDFLKVRGEKSMKDYFAKKRWYDFDTNDPNFRTELKPVYEKYRQLLQNLSPAVLKAFDVVINEGYFNPSKRVTYRQWLRVLLDKPAPTALKTVEIQSFFAQKREITYGEEIEISWRVKDAISVSLNGQNLPDLQKGSIKVKPLFDTTFLLSATGQDGKTVNNMLTVKVLPATNVVKNIPQPDTKKNQNTTTQVLQPVQTIITPVQPVTPPSTAVSLPDNGFWTERIVSLLVVGEIFMSIRVVYVIQEYVAFGMIAAALGGLVYFLSKRFENFAAVKEKMLTEKELAINQNGFKQTDKQLSTLQAQLLQLDAEDAKLKSDTEQQIKELQAKERVEKEKINNQLQAQLQPVQQKIKDLKTEEEVELHQEVEKLYQKVLDRELSLYLVLTADIDGFQPLFKTELTLNGIYSAADIVDIDKNGNILKRNGEWVRVSMLTSNKVDKLWEWKKNIVEKIRKQYPQALPPDKKNAIRQKYTLQIQDLILQENLLQSQIQQQLQNITLQYAQQISQLQLQLNNTGSLKRQALEQQIRQTRQVVQQFELKDKDLQARLDHYKSISFGQYLGKIAGIFA